MNLPYEQSFSPLLVAYLCGICSFGLLPRVALEIPGGDRRLDRIVDLIEGCRYSIHDLSCVTLDSTKPRTPRFNMPFELGICVHHSMRRLREHTWFVFESQPWRLQKSLSDLNGSDPYIHASTADGVFRELARAFVRAERQPTVQQMRKIYEAVSEILPRILTDAAALDVFNARVIQDVVIAALSLVQA